MISRLESLFEDSTYFSSKSFSLQNLLRDSNPISKDSNPFSPKSFCLQNFFIDSNPSFEDSNLLLYFYKNSSYYTEFKRFKLSHSKNSFCTYFSLSLQIQSFKSSISAFFTIQHHISSHNHSLTIKFNPKYPNPWNPTQTQKDKSEPYCKCNKKMEAILVK